MASMPALLSSLSESRFQPSQQGLSLKAWLLCLRRCSKPSLLLECASWVALCCCAHHPPPSLPHSPAPNCCFPPWRVRIERLSGGMQGLRRNRCARCSPCCASSYKLTRCILLDMASCFKVPACRADTLRSKIANVALFTSRPDLLMYGFLAVMIAAAFWDNLSALQTTCLALAVGGALASPEVMHIQQLACGRASPESAPPARLGGLKLVVSSALCSRAGAALHCIARPAELCQLSELACFQVLPYAARCCQSAQCACQPLCCWCCSFQVPV